MCRLTVVLLKILLQFFAHRTANFIYIYIYFFFLSFFFRKITRSYKYSYVNNNFDNNLIIIIILIVIIMIVNANGSKMALYLIHNDTNFLNFLITNLMYQCC